MTRIAIPFTGHRDHRIDGKDRVVIPSAFASQIQAASEGRLYLVPSAEAPCLEAYPATVFDQMAEQQVPDRFQGEQGGRRLFFQNAEMVELKGPGRITLPKRFLGYFPRAMVRVAGMNRYLELWDPETWESHVGRSAGPLPGALPPPGGAR